MTRQLIPGAWGRCGRAIPDANVSELDNVVPMREDMRQGRDSRTPVPRYSMLSGIPRTEEDDEFRGAVWRVLAVFLAAFWCALAVVALAAGYSWWSL
jgi:hypothetical protein